ncbi:MAG: hypothetical protein C3L25_08140 [Candidatus Sedimenticola endophacoides]|nr:MAG: hypothetical protein C3L26_08155 [Candidatus Sedimenticola endophacoides]PUD99707.1 MAG: hypothetical protein C3L26_08160 [Candidatus Sedimenticola endophacoides]PUD99708.1 MAG: hypothetical protein C3L26_08165 [Candidatus Sedimenticola endophacoides]PUE03372.1 MAG: hypothetical protein C3L25_08130 [Candidatus Sedimenticola endophacoides]PUE03373.1 MAG: hypothetical protein C3L25_08135 [Candidatus Sedimenticola endophacoides]
MGIAADYFALAGVLLLLVIVYWNHRLRGEVRMRKEMARRIGIVEKRTRLLYELDRQTPKLSERQVCERAVDIAVELSDSQVGYLHLIDADQQHLTRMFHKPLGDHKYRTTRLGY